MYLTLQKFIYIYIYIYESKKIRNDTKELLTNDKRKHFKLQDPGCKVWGLAFEQEGQGS